MRLVVEQPASLRRQRPQHAAVGPTPRVSAGAAAWRALAAAVEAAVAVRGAAGGCEGEKGCEQGRRRHPLLPRGGARPRGSLFNGDGPPWGGDGKFATHCLKFAIAAPQGPQEVSAPKHPMVRLPLPLLALPLAAGAGAPAGPEAAVSALLTRLLPTHAADFEPSLLQPSACHGETRLCFGYSAGSAAGKVALKGTSGVE
eukprot:COSAG04_NODE_6978_length_1216_cov_2.557744_2_plen_199_part_01